MRDVVVAFVCGLLFAVGLALSGMTQPAKVVGFLDFFGDWDPSLAFVMGGAIAIYMPFYRRIVRMRSPFMAGVFDLPSATKITPRLLIGSALFGIGWAIGGFCPGPALVSLSTATQQAAVFVGAMAAGMLAWTAVDKKMRAG